MRSLARGAWAAVHVALGLVALAWLSLTRRGGVAVFTHFQDVDAKGNDAQMGPLVSRLARERIPFAEIALVPLGTAIGGALALKGRLFVPWAAVLGPARLWQRLTGSDLARTRAALARVVLRALRPRALYLVDESGSGQPLVRAARALGIRTVGVQHGGFLGGNPQYAPAAGRAFEVAPVDVLCVWSEWFRAQLLAASPVYDLANTRVTGRLRTEAALAVAEAVPASAGERIRVLVLGEASDAKRAVIARAVEHLERAGFELRVRPHPATEGRRRLPPLAGDLAWADLVAGVASTALLEACFARRPAVVLEPADPAAIAYVFEGFAIPCADASEWTACIRRALMPEHRARVDEARARIWGGAPEDAAAAVIEAGRP